MNFNKLVVNKCMERVLVSTKVNRTKKSTAM